MQQEADQCRKGRDNQRIGADVWYGNFSCRVVCQMGKCRTFPSVYTHYNIVCNIHLYFFRDNPRMENINKNHSESFPVSADIRLGVLFYYKTVPVNLYRTCYVADKNGQKYIPVNYLTENKSVIGLAKSKKPCIVVNAGLLIYYSSCFGNRWQRFSSLRIRSNSSATICLASALMRL